MNMRYQTMAVAVSMALSGCASFKNLQDGIDRAESDAEEGKAVLQKMQQAPKQREMVMFSDAPIVSLTPAIINKPKIVPSALKCPITFAPTVGVSVYEFGQAVARACGFQVRVTPDALTLLAGSSQPGTASAQGAGQQPAPGGGGQAQGAGAAAGGHGGMAPLISGVRWVKAPVSGLLDMVTGRLGLSWKFSEEDGLATIFYTDSETFDYFAFAHKTTLSTLVQSGTTIGTSGAGGGGSGAAAGGASGGSSSAGGTSGSSQSTSVTLESSMVDDIEKSIASMLTPGVGRSALSRGTGKVSVTDTPNVLKAVGSYLRSTNKDLSKQVLLNVRMLTASVINKDVGGINWKVIYKSINGKYGVNLSSNFAADPNAVSAAVNILDKVGSTSPLSGSEMIVEALAQQTHIGSDISPSVATLNLKAVPVLIGHTTGYLATSQTTNTAQVGSTSSLIPGTVTSGFNMRLLPYVLPGKKGELMLDVAVNQSTPPNLRTKSSGDASVEFPDQDTNIFSQTVRIKSGQTFVLSGVEQNSSQADRSGVGAPSNFLFGGGFSASKNKNVVVLMITPIVQE